MMLRGAPADSIAASFTSDGELLLPGSAPLRGRAAIAKFLARVARATQVVSVEMRPDSQRVAGTGAQQRGRYVQVAGPRGGPTHTYRGSYDALWRLEADGRWRFVRLTMRAAQ
jgi:ketosteroid isomerase-like protein